MAMHTPGEARRWLEAAVASRPEQSKQGASKELGLRSELQPETIQNLQNILDRQDDQTLRETVRVLVKGMHPIGVPSISALVGHRSIEIRPQRHDAFVVLKALSKYLGEHGSALILEELSSTTDNPDDKAVTVLASMLKGSLERSRKIDHGDGVPDLRRPR